MKSEPRFWQDDWRSDVIERGLKASDGLALVAEENSKIVGFICAHDFGFRAYLSEFIIHKNTRGKGIGKKLLKEVEKELHKRGCRILISDVWHNAESFYRNLGYEQPDVILLRKKIF
ncbi:MAG: hypothetical protein A2Y58_04720 [Chloroflexi bacterium RBG_13_51_52]|nr:MAG: hypothetical protein A2Y58_04720 [Chloroflexi bacterium RBG_13_51_52]